MDTNKQDSSVVLFLRSGSSPNGMARQYCLSFPNVLYVRQGKEYAKWNMQRVGAETSRDVRRRIVKAGHDGVRIEYDGGVVDYVAFSNKGIIPMVAVEHKLRVGGKCADVWTNSNTDTDV